MNVNLSENEGVSEEQDWRLNEEEHWFYCETGSWSFSDMFRKVY